MALADVRNTSMQLSVPASHAKSGRTRTATCTLLELLAVAVAVAVAVASSLRAGDFTRVGLETFPVLVVAVPKPEPVPELVPRDGVLVLLPVAVLGSLATLFVSSTDKVLLLRVAAVMITLLKPPY
jgi:hypothetical protein